jgi:uncharacterized membrane protein
MNALDVVSESVLVPLAPYVLAVHALLIALLAGLLLGAVLLVSARGDLRLGRVGGDRWVETLRRESSKILSALLLGGIAVSIIYLIGAIVVIVVVLRLAGIL